MSDEVVSTIDPEEIVNKEVTQSGQIYLGRNLAGKKVKVAYEIVDDEE